MTTTTVSSPTVLRPASAARPEVRDRGLDETGVSRTTWRLLRSAVTVLVFAAATALGVGVGLAASTASPVPPAAAAHPPAAGPASAASPSATGGVGDDSVVR